MTKTCLDCRNYLYCRPDRIHWYFNVPGKCRDRKKDKQKEWEDFDKAWKQGRRLAKEDLNGCKEKVS